MYQTGQSDSRQYPTPAISVPAIRNAGSNVASTVPSATFIGEGISAENDSGNGRQLHITPGSLPDSANKLTKPARALLMRLLEKDPKVRLRSHRQLQQSAFYLGFNFEHVKAKKVSPKYVLENHIDSHLTKLSSLKITNKDDFLEFDQEVVS